MMNSMIIGRDVWVKKTNQNYLQSCIQTKYNLLLFASNESLDESKTSNTGLKSGGNVIQSKLNIYHFNSIDVHRPLISTLLPPPQIDIAVPNNMVCCVCWSDVVPQAMRSASANSYCDYDLSYIGVCTMSTVYIYEFRHNVPAVASTSAAPIDSVSLRCQYNLCPTTTLSSKTFDRVPAQVHFLQFPKANMPPTASTTQRDGFVLALQYVGKATELILLPYSDTNSGSVVTGNVSKADRDMGATDGVAKCRSLHPTKACVSIVPRNTVLGGGKVLCIDSSSMHQYDAYIAMRKLLQVTSGGSSAPDASVAGDSKVGLRSVKRLGEFGAVQAPSAQIKCAYSSNFSGSKNDCSLSGNATRHSCKACVLCSRAGGDQCDLLNSCVLCLFSPETDKVIMPSLFPGSGTGTGTIGSGSNISSVFSLSSVGASLDWQEKRVINDSFLQCRQVTRRPVGHKAEDAGVGDSETTPPAAEEEKEGAAVVTVTSKPTPAGVDGALGALLNIKGSNAQGGVMGPTVEYTGVGVRESANGSVLAVYLDPVEESGRAVRPVAYAHLPPTETGGRYLADILVGVLHSSGTHTVVAVGSFSSRDVHLLRVSLSGRAALDITLLRTHILPLNHCCRGLSLINDCSVLLVATVTTATARTAEKPRVANVVGGTNTPVGVAGTLPTTVPLPSFVPPVKISANPTELFDEISLLTYMVESDAAAVPATQIISTSLDTGTLLSTDTSMCAGEDPKEAHPLPEPGHLNSSALLLTQMSAALQQQQHSLAVLVGKMEGRQVFGGVVDAGPSIVTAQGFTSADPGMQTLEMELRLKNVCNQIEYNNKLIAYCAGKLD